MNCLVCNNLIANNLELLRCVACKEVYHYMCLNMTTTLYMGKHQELQKTWLCPSCKNITSRQKPNSTPVRKRFDFTELDNTTMSIDDSIIQNETQQSILGDTINSQQHLAQGQTTMLDQISMLLDLKLKENNDTIINTLKSLIQLEINSAIDKLKQDFIQKNDKILTQQKLFSNQLEETNMKIKLLERENQRLTTELRELQTSLNNAKELTNNGRYNQSNHFILYGLNEYHGEKEADLYPRISNMFSDILNIDINGFIETVKRIGKKGHRRPVIIELLSKRMKKYVMENAYCFKDTGYAVCEVLDSDALQKRSRLRKKMLEARKEGHHAVIRKNLLYINGQVKYIPDSHTQDNCNDTASPETTKQRENNILDQRHEVNDNSNQSDNLFRV